jgi:hypothetical protein
LEHWSSQLNGCNCWDQVLEEWGISWWPSAIAHGHPLFTTTYLDAPAGVNLMWNTSMPALGLLASPLSVTLGPVHTFLVLLVLSAPVSGAAMFVLLRRWTNWWPTAWVGGLLYSFSSYMAAQGSVGRLHLLFIPCPPLIILVVDKLLRDPHPRRIRLGLTLGMLFAAQFLISEEIFLITVLLIATGLVVILLQHRGAAVRRGRALGRSAVAAVVSFLAVTGYFLLVQFFGPDRLTGPPQPYAQLDLFSSDLLSPVIPGSIQYFHPLWATAISNRFDAGTPGEVGAYMGITLLVFLLVGVVLLRRRPVVQLFAVMGLVSFALSLGPRVIVANHHLAIPGPYALLTHLPVVSDFIPGRFAMGLWFSVAVLFAVVLDELWSALTRRLAGDGPSHRRRAEGRQHQLRRWAPTIATLLVASACLLPLIPNWPYTEVPAQVPTFFTSSAVDQVPPGALMVTYPYPLPGSDAPMVWQADTAMRFRLLGGYYISADPSGAGTLFGDPNALSTCLSAISQVGGSATSMCDPTSLERALARLGVESIAVDPMAAHAEVARQVLTAVVGTEPRSVEGVYLWQCLPVRSPPGCRWH